MRDKRLKAGILEDEQLTYPTEATPQGGGISPLLSNIYPHYALDLRFEEEIQPLLSERSFMVRFADDFVMGFKNAIDGERVMKVLPMQLEKYKLELHPRKTKIINLNCKRGKGGRSFDFLGFTHNLCKSRKGKKVLKRKTSSIKLRYAISKTDDWIKRTRHGNLKVLIYDLNIKPCGHNNYYGVTFNSFSLKSYYEQVKRSLHKCLNRRGGNPSWNWGKFEKLIYEWRLLIKSKIYHSHLSAKPN